MIYSAQTEMLMHTNGKRKEVAMKVDVLVAEIGSTTTVVNAFKDIDTDNPVFWAQGQAPTSVLEGDVRIGLQGAIDDLCAKNGTFYRICSAGIF